MSGCQHRNFRANVEVGRIAKDGKGEDVIHFVADVRVMCLDCGGEFGFRGAPAGHSWDEPRCRVDAKQITLPLMSPAELELAGPLPAAERGPMIYEFHPRAGAGFHAGDLRNELRRVFAEHGVNITVGQYDSGGLFMQSHDGRVMTIED